MQQIVDFLRAQEQPLARAEEACFALTMCGAVDPAGANGEVASAAAVVPCLKSRARACQDTSQVVSASKPPELIQGPWKAWLEFRLGKLHKKAHAIDATVKSRRLPTKKLRVDGDTVGDVLTWGARKNVQPAVEYYAWDEVAAAQTARQAEAAILKKMPGVCQPNIRCTIKKVMHGSLSDVRRAYRVPP